MVFLDLNNQKKILIISTSEFISGAEKSLFELFRIKNPKFEFILSVPKNVKYIDTFYAIKLYKVPFCWMYKTLNPFRYIQFICSFFISTVQLIRIVKNEAIEIIYANTIKSLLYGLLLKQFSGKKIIWHARDNINKFFLNKYLIVKCDKVICVSFHIYKQLPPNLHNKQIVYGGVDTTEWLAQLQKDPIMRKKNITKIVVIAYIAQLTPWKNHKDFIKAANIIKSKYRNVRFLIVGDDLSGKDVKYKKKILNLIKQLNLAPHMRFLGYKNNIVEIISQIDIILHPAINEPFGRVIIEAMAMEKPVVAYNCGGPAEIIKNGETGYLVEPKNYHQLAEKTMELIENRGLQIAMGKVGRQRVIEKFNIERYLSKMEEVFDSL